MRKNSSGIKSQTILEASFRDPAGFLFKDDKGTLLRQVNPAGRADFELLESSGLYAELLSEKLVVSHRKLKAADDQESELLLEPEFLPFITYPFEWSFSALQDAALLTLELEKRALKKGITLKDASAYNVQFKEGRAIFIDTLSFEKYSPGEAWQAYRQFCQHFLAPLCLMSYTDLRLQQLLKVNLDGIPLDMATKLLPRRAKLKPLVGVHIALHAKAQKSREGHHKKPKTTVSQARLEAIIDSLERGIKRLKPYKYASEWGDYYANTNYSPAAADTKAKLLSELITPLKIRTAIDLGGNNGRYCRVLNEKNIFTVCGDIDPNAVEANYLHVRQKQETKMLPVVLDLTNPTGGLGWHNKERHPFHDRIRADLVLALALVHHLAISNNLPFDRIAEYFSEFAPYLIIEFVPKDDSQVQKLLSTRKDIFSYYDEDNFEKSFKQHYSLTSKVKISGSKRTLYLFKRERDGEKAN